MTSEHAGTETWIPVAIGLIGRDGWCLIRQRPDMPGSPMAGYWEFPGGKCHADETPVDCVRRECLEEVGLEVNVQGLRGIIRHVYPHGRVEMHFFDCILADVAGEPEPSTGFRWVKTRELRRYRFPGANEAIVSDLARTAWTAK